MVIVALIIMYYALFLLVNSCLILGINHLESNILRLIFNFTIGSGLKRYGELNILLIIQRILSVCTTAHVQIR